MTQGDEMTVDHAANRDEVVRALVAELVGPSPRGAEIDCNGPVSFPKAEDSYGPWKQKPSGEEILLRDAPCKRYGVGVLFPVSTPAKDEVDSPPGDEEALEFVKLPAGKLPGGSGEPLGEKAVEVMEKVEERLPWKGADPDPDEFDLSSANAYRPSCIGVSFLAELQQGSSLEVVALGGRYKSKEVQVAGKTRVWWLRSPVEMRARFSAESLWLEKSGIARPEAPEVKNGEGLDLHLEVYSRPHQGNHKVRLLTVYLVNRTRASRSVHEYCLFQTRFRATVIFKEGGASVLPYPGPPAERLDAEEQSLSLLYRNAQTFAVGHGCAAEWGLARGEMRASWVAAECLPTCEVPSITPDITRPDGSGIEVSMVSLAGLAGPDDGFSSLEEVVGLYERWIERQEASIPALQEKYRAPAARHVAECRSCAKRMREGIAYLRSDTRAKKAFKLANQAMLLQQLHSRRSPRIATFDAKARRFIFAEPFAEPDASKPVGNRGKWRAFQIAFMLMTVKSAAESEAPDRSAVELIWFPTGGGKTEAYLGLTAFTLFMRRLADPDDAGVHVLMRYTLRLLTAQQFQRASGLLCAMEKIRRDHADELGSAEFSIGIWLGGANTPNTHEEAVRTLRGLQSGDQSAENLFLVSRCPWCSAQMGVVEYKGPPPKSAPRVRGYVQRGATVAFECPDPQCRFATGLPIYVIDEDLYEKRPSLVIGTVDKFAMLAWRPAARSLFGLAPDGSRFASPPGLIIQDELHLISGPLGSVVGLYEVVIEELCTDRRGRRTIIPKLVSSTATIRRYQDQIRSLYGRKDASLFPPPGLDAGDSFFSRYATRKDGTLERGRIFAGVHAPALGSMQTAQVRTFTALLQAPTAWPPEARDPWWTLLLFFNSLRELGTTLSLFQSDIPNYLKIIKNRTGLDWPLIRRLWSYRSVMELTGRLRSEEVPAAISALEVTTSSSEPPPVDVCLASNIIEVGIDIDRLSLMAVVGQPKTTSQYIQVTGRVGRKWDERPGLVVTIYGASKPRDRSHFEKFRSYHERLYSQVEPTSVTPFSPPVLDRALHAIMAAYVRQAGSTALADSPHPFPEGMIEALKRILLPRVQVVDPEEVIAFERVFAKRAAEWKRWERTKWRSGPQDLDAALLREAGAYTNPGWADISWPTPMSMRNVDSECQAEITQLYLNQEEGKDA